MGDGLAVRAQAGGDVAIDSKQSLSWHWERSHRLDSSMGGGHYRGWETRSEAEGEQEGREVILIAVNTEASRWYRGTIMHFRASRS